MRFISEHHIQTLNIAGPRASKELWGSTMIWSQNRRESSNLGVGSPQRERRLGNTAGRLEARRFIPGRLMRGRRDARSGGYQAS